VTVPEQAGKVATSAIDALRQSPGMLALIMLQVITLGILYFVNDRQNERRAAREMMILDRCLAQQEKK